MGDLDTPIWKLSGRWPLAPFFLRFLAQCLQGREHRTRRALSTLCGKRGVSTGFSKVQGYQVASRVETIPEDFLQHLNKSYTGFEAEKDRHKFALARMAWIGMTKGNQHSHFPDAMSFSYKELDAAFGRSKFTEVNSRLNFFNRTTNWSKDDHHTRGYMFSSRARAAIKEYLDRSSGATLTRLVMADGKALEKIPAGVASKDKSGVTTKAWTNAKALNLVRVNLEALERLKRELAEACEVHRAAEKSLGRSVIPEVAGIERTVAMINKVEVLSRTEAAGLGVMAHHYEEHPMNVEKRRVRIRES